MTTLPEKRLAYVPKIPKALQHLLHVRCEADRSSPNVRPEIADLFPHLHKTPTYRIVSGASINSMPLKVGVVFSGGPASGGHNVLAGLFDAMCQIHPASKLIGFVGGFSGLVNNMCKELSAQQIDAVRNQGGFDLIGTGRAKIESVEDMQKAHAALHSFDAFVVIGGDDSNTNGALLAEYLLDKGSKTTIIGIPKTIDGDLRSRDIELSFGFDSACKTYAELIGNICRDALSTRKYYHFIKLMGRSASHIAVECALLTQPNLTIVGEERKSLAHIVQEIVDLIIRRKAVGKEFGVILVPEGLIEFIPEIGALTEELSRGVRPEKLGSKDRSTWALLPEKIQSQLLNSKDPHGNICVSQISTEELLIQLVKKELMARNFQGSANFQEHFFGYEGRSCLPTNFDANYAYSLGILGAMAARDRATGVICALRSLKESPDRWIPVVSSLVPMIHLEERNGSQKPVIAKVLVDVKGPHFITFSTNRNQWAIEDQYRFPGPIQFFGDPVLTDACPYIVRNS
jgi:pyrophosphate--fructose-6-phosphate 1-phosphotransferase